MRILILTLIVLATTCSADPVNLKITQFTLTPPAGFSKTGTDGKWDFYERGSQGFRLSVMPDGLAHEDNTDFIWAALTSLTPFTEPITFTFTAKVCLEGSCGTLQSGGALAYSTDGLRWAMLPPAVTIPTTDGNRLALSFVSNQPGLLSGRTAFATVDGGLSGHFVPTILPAAPVPEPASLLLLGSGLAALAARLRKRTRT